MSRFVAPRPSGATLAAEGGGDNYAARVAKYVPAEVVAAYTALLGFLSTAPADRQVLYGILAFVVCFVANPLYLWRLSTKANKAGLQIVVSSLAFPVWAYAVGGDRGIFGAAGLEWYEPVLASMLLVIFTLLGGLLRPEQGAT